MESGLTAEFEEWVRSKYIPEACRSACLCNPVFTRLLTEIDPGTAGYAVQFTTPSLEEAGKWHDNEGAIIKEEFMGRHNGRIVFFTTFMEVL